MQVVTTLLENGADIEVGHDLGDQRWMQDQFDLMIVQWRNFQFIFYLHIVYAL